MCVRSYTHFIEPLSGDEVVIYGYFDDVLSEQARVESLEEALSYVLDDVNEALWDDFNWREMYQPDYVVQSLATHRPQNQRLKVTTSVKVEAVNG